MFELKQSKEKKSLQYLTKRKIERGKGGGKGSSESNNAGRATAMMCA